MNKDSRVAAWNAIIVDTPEPDSTNDRNTARKFFKFPEKEALKLRELM